jgi:hypothetical protein
MLPVKVMAPGSAVDANGNVVVVAGFGYEFDQYYSNHTYILDTAARTWSRGPDFPFKVMHPSISVLSK